jgi:hypothetical protein
VNKQYRLSTQEADFLTLARALKLDFSVMTSEIIAMKNKSFTNTTGEGREGLYKEKVSIDWNKAFKGGK